MKATHIISQETPKNFIFKNLFLVGAIAALTLTACTKDNAIAEKSLDQQKIEFQQRQLEIEQQKLAIEKEKMAYETQKKMDSITEAKQAVAAAPRPQVIRETKTVYVNNTPRQVASSGSNTGASQGTTQKQGMSKAAKGTIIGTVGGAAAGAIINKKNRGVGAVVGGVVGGATGYTIGRAGDRKDGRVQPKN
ncbi:YMGG-like glycine zipper-containing protein [Kaistella yonginensis]|uniref:YMGG-like glycine zipper-containing protein n=1 Tax=Kaistella yonginensis TaxID=658267 RepID=UPI0025B47C9E|nr:YMGG-like glycine zipper-containing protein [Kaistella yonginensis]MDN3607630.1 YMGG-like glycine zipper-containing protein [Kaistella yonginensis]